MVEPHPPREADMIKTILVPASGTDSDSAAFATALVLAELLGAHLAFHHARLTIGDAARHTPHMAYCVANGMPDAFDHLNRQIDTLSTRAQAHVVDFCREHGLTRSLVRRHYAHPHQRRRHSGLPVPLKARGGKISANAYIHPSFFFPRAAFHE
jgi:nucleotide-binding universal stress UspA family protein